MQMQSMEEYFLFYHELGVALSQWAMVEYSLAMVGNSCFNEDERNISRAGFFAIDSFRSKLKYTEMLLEEKGLDKKSLDEWRGIKERVSKAAQKRNKLAHQQVVGSLGVSKPGRCYALTPWHEDKQKKRIPKKGAIVRHPESIYLMDIVRIRYEFSYLFGLIQNFVSKIRGQSISYPNTLTGSPVVPTLSQYRKSMREMLEVIISSKVKKND